MTKIMIQAIDDNDRGPSPNGFVMKTGSGLMKNAIDMNGATKPPQRTLAIDLLLCSSVVPVIEDNKIDGPRRNPIDATMVLFLSRSAKGENTIEDSFVII